jgi:hypothetical protein
MVIMRMIRCRMLIRCCMVIADQVPFCLVRRRKVARCGHLCMTFWRVRDNSCQDHPDSLLLLLLSGPCPVACGAGVLTPRSDTCPIWSARDLLMLQPARPYIVQVGQAFIS